MTSHALESVALTLVAGGKGILAANETVPTLTKRFDTLGIRSTEQSRRTSREMLFICPGGAEFIGGAIMYDETIRQKSASGAPLAEALTVQGILPGIKVDTGAQPLAGSPNEIVTEGLDALRDRPKEYRRALRGGDRCGPSRGVPRPHRAGCRRRGDTAQAQHGHRWQGVRPPRLGGRGRRRDIALFAPACACRGAWDRILVERPTGTPGTAHLNAINQVPTRKPWKVSYGRALQDPALEVWQRRDENVHRTRLNAAASVGTYTSEMEVASPSDEDPPHRHDCRDD